MTPKIYAFALALAFTGINAQTKNIIRTNSTPTKTNFSHNKSSEILLEQDSDVHWIVNFPSITDEFGNSFMTIDDCKFTTDVTLTKLQTVGNVWGANDLLQSATAVRVMIFEDENGKPKGKPGSSANSIFYKDIPINDPAIQLVQDDNLIDSFLEVDLVAANDNRAVALQANKTYWVSIALKQNLDGQFVESEKTWTRTSAPELYNDSFIIDENNVLGMGLNEWTPVLDVLAMLSEEPHPFPEKVNGQNIIIYGDSTLGTTEVFSTANVNIFPNPATDVINFKNAEKVSKTEVYNTAGQLVLSSTDKVINIQKLTKGTYFVKQHLIDGTRSNSKFIKK